MPNKKNLESLAWHQIHSAQSYKSELTINILLSGST